MAIQVQSLHVYPVKSCGAIDLAKATLTERGFEYDRMWMVVNHLGKMITQREAPMLAMIRPEIADDHLILRSPNVPALAVPLKQDLSSRVKLHVWGSECNGHFESDESHQWLSQLLRSEAYLVRFDKTFIRSLDPIWVGEITTSTSFADGAPYSIANLDSLIAFNDLREEQGLSAVPMSRFRPNIVVSGDGAWAEDHWGALAGEFLKFDLTGATPRCDVINVDQNTAKREKGIQANLSVLSKYRKFFGKDREKNSMFGVDAIVTQGIGRTMEVGMSLHNDEPTVGMQNLPRLSTIEKSKK